MTRIAVDQDVVTMMNVFTVAPENQQRLVDLLVEAAEQVMAPQLGYISAAVHRGLDGTKVAVYAQWRSQKDFQALTGNPEAAAHMRRARELATFEPVLYEAVFAHRT
jgi:heme-degrading monooxygenase HmoA